MEQTFQFDRQEEEKVIATRGDHPMAFHMVGGDGEDLTSLVEEYLEKAEGMREFLDRLIASAGRAGWSLGEKKSLMPGIWAVRAA